jgi:hypothetical protein
MHREARLRQRLGGHETGGAGADDGDLPCAVRPLLV